MALFSEFLLSLGVNIIHKLNMISQKMKNAQDDLEGIPGVGPKMARELRALGVQSVSDLSNRDPEDIYQDLIRLRKKPVDRCVLYVFRCAVYFANTAKPDPKLLKWWRWKDRK